MDIKGIIEKIEAGDMEGAKNMIEPHSESINEIHSNNRSYLMLASELGNIDLIKLLVDAGADLNMCNNSNYTALHYAVENCQPQAVTILISLGSDVNRTSTNGQTPLHLAVRWAKERKDVVAALLQTKGNSTIEINKIHSNNRSYLMLASQLGNIDLIKLLVDAGADLNMCDKSNYTALHYAVDNCQPQAVTILISLGSDVNRTNTNGQTPLHLAVRSAKERKDVVAALLQTKGNSTIEVNQQDHSFRRTPLHHASELGRRDTVHLLLNHTGINVNISDRGDNTALHLAVEKGHYDVVTLLLSQDSVQLDIKDSSGRTPFLLAVRRGYLGIINELIARGVEVNAVDSARQNCLFSALGRDAFHSENEHIALLDKCCTELKRSKDNRLSGIVVAWYLSRKGADFYHKDNRARTPLDCITNEVLKEKLQTFLQSRCILCEVNEATVEFQPCAHNAVCEECYTIKLRRCPKCKTYIKSPRVFENLKLVNKQVQAAVPTSERKALQVETPKCVKEVLTTSQQIESPILKEKDLLRVAKRLGSNWWQVAIFLETDTTELELNCDSNDTVKLGYLMLRKWFQSCDPETRTLETLRAALEEAECSTALQYSSLDAK